MLTKLMYDGKLEISTNGDVFRIKRGNRIAAAVNHVSRNKSYATTTICIDGKQQFLYIHRLVAEAFIPNPEGKPHINHIDGNPRNNNVDNLEWCTPSENTQHALKTGLMEPMKNSVPCVICQKLTRAKGGRCPRCKREEAQRKATEKSQKKALANIRNELDGVFIRPKRTRDKEVLDMRLQGKTYEEIGDHYGFSRQYIHDIVRRTKVKSESLKLALGEEIFQKICAEQK